MACNISKVHFVDHVGVARLDPQINSDSSEAQSNVQFDGSINPPSVALDVQGDNSSDSSVRASLSQDDGSEQSSNAATVSLRSLDVCDSNTSTVTKQQPYDTVKSLARCDTIIIITPSVNGISLGSQNPSGEKRKPPTQAFLALRKVSSVPQLFDHVVAYLGDLWAWELLGCLLALVSLLVIIAILVAYQDSPLPQWPNYISINTIISVCTAVMKAALMLPATEGISQMKWSWFRGPEARQLSKMEEFDSASRGPWGAFLLMIEPHRHCLASFGAFITIALMAIDPFSQQIIQYYNCLQVNSNTAAYLPRSNNYSGEAILTHSGTDAAGGVISSRTAAAVQLGVIDWSPDADLLIDYNCSSGNCTFLSTPEGSTFSTIGMCQSCKDISQEIYLNQTDNGTYMIPTPYHTAHPRVGWTNISAQDPWTLLYSRKWPLPLEEFDPLITLDFIMFDLNNPDSCDWNHAENCPIHPWAVRCSLIPCIKTYSAIVTNGNLYENELDTTLLKKTNQSGVEITTSVNLTWSLATDTIIRNGEVHQCEVSDTASNSTPIGISSNGTLALEPDEIVKYYETDCVWVFDYLEALTLNQYISSMFDAYYLTGETNSTVSTGGSDWLRHFHLNGTATLKTSQDYFESLSSTITAAIRGYGPQSGFVPGDVLTMQTCIGVQWPWLALPSVLFILVVIFLALVTVDCATTKTWRGAWRSSALAPFFHCVDDDVRKEVEHLTSKREMEDAAKKLYVWMVEEEDGLKMKMMKMKSERSVLGNDV
ncbi:hypothetical protein BX600DRAFT_543279 [Xylariales sp. PMI_506]|nr:hypothetical protein BX600DRAFT_543279 [Xylariales sp. PMI_506]